MKDTDDIWFCDKCQQSFEGGSPCNCEPQTTKLEELAVRCGVKIIDCDKSWGGKYGYTTKDSTNVSVCGFRTKKAAYWHWFRDTFGTYAGNALMEMLELKV